jgi:hypothetical protein
MVVQHIAHGASNVCKYQESQYQQRSGSCNKPFFAQPSFALGVVVQGAV